MRSLPIIGRTSLPPGFALTGDPPWMHVVPGAPPLVLLVHGSQLYEVDDATAERLQAGDPAAVSKLSPLATARETLRLDEVTAPLAPSALSLNVAQACNLGCHYCYADEGRFQGEARVMPEAVALEAIDRLIDGAAGRHVTVGFIGGEPFLQRELIHRAVAHANTRAATAGITVRFSITTNGTLLQEHDVALLRDHAFSVSVSLDGDATTHDRHRPQRDGRGSHARAVAALKPLLANPGTARLAARASITRDDLRVDERVRSLLALGFHEAGVSPVRTGPASQLPLREEDWPSFLAAMVEAADAEFARIRATGGRTPFRFGNLAIALKEIHRGACRPLPCGAGYNYLSVSAQGDYFTCHRTVDDSRFAMGNAESGPQLEARQRFVTTRQVDRQEPCRRCWARYLCGGGCHAEVVAVGRAGCDYIRSWLEHCLRLYTAVAAEFPHLLTTSEGSRDEQDHSA